MRNPEIRDEIDNAIEHYNGIRYDLHAYVVMPNHVHILLVMHKDYNIEDILTSVKKFSAGKINALTGSRGKFWDGQNYCRIIRNQDHYDNVRSYINSNPRFLKRGEFTLRNYY